MAVFILCRGRSYFSVTDYRTAIDGKGAQSVRRHHEGASGKTLPIYNLAPYRPTACLSKPRERYFRLSQQLSKRQQVGRPVRG